MPRKRSKEAVSKRAAARSFAKRVQKVRASDLKNRTGNSNLLNFDTGVKDLFKSIIKEFSVLRKTDGLITGTNKVLRLLDKETLAVVFMCKEKGSSSLKESIYRICGQAGVPFIWLEDKDKHTLGPEFPESITYGIKKESLATLGNLRNLLLELSLKRTIRENENDTVSPSNISSNEMKFSSTEESTSQEVLNVSTFHHTHKGHISKKSNYKETGFLSLNKFSTDEKETDFLNYDSIAYNGILAIK